MKKGQWANIPPKSNRSDPICFSPHLYRARSQFERFFNRIKQCRHVATRYDRLAGNYLAFSNSHLSGYGWPRVMSPRPSTVAGVRGYSAASLCPSRAFSLRISSSAASAITVPGGKMASAPAA